MSSQQKSHFCILTLKLFNINLVLDMLSLSRMKPEVGEKMERGGLKEMEKAFLGSS